MCKLVVNLGRVRVWVITREDFVKGKKIPTKPTTTTKNSQFQVDFIFWGVHDSEIQNGS